jgi:hypothetical protein
MIDFMWSEALQLPIKLLATGRTVTAQRQAGILGLFSSQALQPTKPST